MEQDLETGRKKGLWAFDVGPQQLKWACQVAYTMVG